MSQPQIYNRKSDFTKNHGSVQNDSLLNTELDNVATTLNGLRDRQAIILKDDDTVQNGIITYDTLSTALQETITTASGNSSSAISKAEEVYALLDEANEKLEQSTAQLDTVKGYADAAKVSEDNAKASADLTAQYSTETLTTIKNNIDVINTVGDKIDEVDKVGENINSVIVVANDLQATWMDGLDLGYVDEATEPYTSATGGLIGKVVNMQDDIQTIAENIDSILATAASVDEIQSTNYEELASEA